MRVLALDIGSSSVKAAVVQAGRLVGSTVRRGYSTRYHGANAEVDPQSIRQAVAHAIHELAGRARKADVLALCAMSPSWLAMGRKGRPLTPIITHQDRRSVTETRELEKRVGKARYLRIAGSRPFPGGISSTTAAWYAQHHPNVLRQAELVGHLTTYLLYLWTGARVTDPSNASFMGVYKTCTLGGWSDELLEAAGLRRRQMPDVLQANQVAGRLSPAAAAELGLPDGLPVLPGIMDTSAAFLPAGAKHGTLLNVSGTTDVLALCVDDPRPHEMLLTRALGLGRKWLAVSTLASAGTTLSWLHRTLFAELSEPAFFRMVDRTLKTADDIGEVRFDPCLAGDRLSIEQKRGVFSGLSLATTRQEMLFAALDALAVASGKRIPLLRELYGHFPRRALVSGGVAMALANVLHRDWTGKWKFDANPEATLLGLGILPDATFGHTPRNPPVANPTQPAKAGVRNAPGQPGL